MPHDDPDPSDPMTLHGIGVETDDPAAMRNMAACFIEEYLRLGFDAPHVLRLFKTAGYAGPHMAFVALGEPTIRGMIDAQLCLRGRRSGFGVATEGHPNGEMSLPVLDA